MPDFKLVSDFKATGDQPQAIDKLVAGLDGGQRYQTLPAPRHTAAIDELCQALNDTHTVYPGTSLTLRYSTKTHR